MTVLASVITSCRQALEDLFQHLCNGDQRLPQAQRAAHRWTDSTVDLSETV